MREGISTHCAILVFSEMKISWRLIPLLKFLFLLSFTLTRVCPTTVRNSPTVPCTEYNMVLSVGQVLPTLLPSKPGPLATDLHLQTLALLSLIHFSLAYAPALYFSLLVQALGQRYQSLEYDARL